MCNDGFLRFCRVIFDVEIKMKYVYYIVIVFEEEMN